MLIALVRKQSCAQRRYESGYGRYALPATSTVLIAYNHQSQRCRQHHYDIVPAVTYIPDQLFAVDLNP